MAFSKLATVFALLAIGQVSGSALRFRDTSEEATCVKRQAKLGSTMICGTMGLTSNTDGASEYPIHTDNFLLCADLCMDTDGCKTFSFDRGQCQMYHQSMDKLGFSSWDSWPDNDSRHAVQWFEMDCFLCENTNWIISGDDFEDANIEDWAIISDNIDNFVMDTQTTKLRNGRETRVLRVGEVATEGNAEIQHFTHFDLKENESYRVTFYGKADARGAEWAPSDFHPITPVIWNNINTVLEWFPERNGGGLPMGDNWYRFRTTFDVPAGKAGDYVFSFIINTSGKELDWYFDDLIIETKP